MALKSARRKEQGAKGILEGRTTPRACRSAASASSIVNASVLAASARCASLAASAAAATATAAVVGDAVGGGEARVYCAAGADAGQYGTAVCAWAPQAPES